MHHALEIQEILFNILGQFYGEHPSVLAILARTCRMFKDPALDRLWRKLNNLSPLARCISEASHKVSPSSKGASESWPTYSFSRPLTPVEWDILRGYTRRVQRISNFRRGLDWESVITFLNLPTTEPLFPNLVGLFHCDYTLQTIHLLRLLPSSLIKFDVRFENLKLFQDFLESFPVFSPDTRRIDIHVYREMSITVDPGYIRCCQDLVSLACPQLALDVEDLVHLSHLSALKTLGCTLIFTIPISTPSILFSHLECLTVRTKSLAPMSRLLSQTQLPVIKKFSVCIPNCPSRQDVTSFLGGIVASNPDCTITVLKLLQEKQSTFNDDLNFQLSLEDLRPCMTFSCLRCMTFDIAWTVGLTDLDLLTLASAWPQLRRLCINEHCMWKTVYGVTPGGLIQLLQMCPSLRTIALRLDTRGYTRVPPSHVPVNLGLTLSPRLSIHSIDSFMEAESEAAIGAFFGELAKNSGPGFALSAQVGLCIPDRESVQRWEDLCWQIRRSSPL